jgi:hypothetical protein
MIRNVDGIYLYQEHLSSRIVFSTHQKNTKKVNMIIFFGKCFQFIYRVKLQNVYGLFINGKNNIALYRQ